jgi:hypothetical protein
MSKARVIYPSLAFDNWFIIALAIVWIASSVYFQSLVFICIVSFFACAVLLAMPRWALRLSDTEVLVCKYFVIWEKLNPKSINRVLFKYASRETDGTIYIEFDLKKKKYRIPVYTTSKQILALNFLITNVGIEKFDKKCNKELERKDIFYDSTKNCFYYR